MSRPLKVLIVDDSDLQADMLAATLQDFGIENCTISLNALEAMQRFEAEYAGDEPFTLVFLDIVMPEMDGQEALKRMRTLELNLAAPEKQRTTIIMTTSLDSPKDMIQALIEGDCDDYIVKPVLAQNVKSMLVKYGFL